MSEPQASRPRMPGYGSAETEELFPWSWAVERLERGHNYWFATTRPDGRPHAMPIWGVWCDGAFYFSTGRQSRKARNLAANPHCVVGVEVGEDAVIVEGTVEEVTEAARLKRFAEVYGPKYEWNMEGFAEPVFVVRPAVAFGFTETGEFAATATRWTFA